MPLRAPAESTSLRLVPPPAPPVPDGAATAAFQAGGPFQAMAEPALLFDRHALVAANRPAAALRRDGTARALLQDAAETVVQTRRTDRLLIPVRPKDRHHLFECDVTPWGEHALVLCRDVTLQTGVREALELSRERYRALLNLAVDCIWETDPDGRVSLLAPNVVFGAAAADFIGRPLQKLIVARAPDFHRGRLIGEWTAAGLVAGKGELVFGAAITEPIDGEGAGRALGMRGCFRQTRALCGAPSDAMSRAGNLNSPGD